MVETLTSKSAQLAEHLDKMSDKDDAHDSEMKQNIDDFRGMVQKLSSSDYKQVEQTGSTPIRKSYEYPNEIVGVDSPNTLVYKYSHRRPSLAERLVEEETADRPRPLSPLSTNVPTSGNTMVKKVRRFCKELR